MSIDYIIELRLGLSPGYLMLGFVWMGTTCFQSVTLSSGFVSLRWLSLQGILSHGRSENVDDAWQG